MIILERVQSVEKDGKRVYFVGRMFVFFIYISFDYYFKRKKMKIN